MAILRRRGAAHSPRFTIFVGLLWLLLALAILAIPILYPPRIEIQWDTESEYQTAGFNVYRSESRNGDYVQINEILIPSKADATSGASYVFVDRDIERGKTYYYRLEDVEYDSSTEQHEILSGQASSSVFTGLLAALSGLAGLVLVISAFRTCRAKH